MIAPAGWRQPSKMNSQDEAGTVTCMTLSTFRLAPAKVHKVRGGE